MSSLTGNQIKDTYPGLLKSVDNTALGAVEKEITDGLGTASTLKLGTTSASFVGDLDLSGATVTGLPAGGGGLKEMYQLKDQIFTATPGIAGWQFGIRPFAPINGTPNINVGVLAGSNEGRYFPFILEEGTFIDSIYAINQSAADAGDTMEVAIFDSVLREGMIYPAQRLTTLASAIPVDVAGNIVVTGINYTLPANTAGCYFLAISTAGTSFAGPRLKGGVPAANWSYSWTSTTAFSTYGVMIQGNERTMPDNKTTGWTTAVEANIPLIGFRS